MTANGATDRGTFMLYEAVAPNIGNSGSADTPVPTCKSPTAWLPLPTVQTRIPPGRRSDEQRRHTSGVVLVDGVNLNTRARIETEADIQTALCSLPEPDHQRGARSFSAGYICYTPLGRSYVNLGPGAARSFDGSCRPSARSRRGSRGPTAAPSAASSLPRTAWPASSRTPDRPPCCFPSPPLSCPPLPPQAAGYTAVEVLMAMTVMTHRRGRGDVHAEDERAGQRRRAQDRHRQLHRAACGSIGSQRDAMQWTLPERRVRVDDQHGGPRRSSSPRQVPGSGSCRLQYLGATNPETMSSAFDILGRDMPTAQLVPAPLTGWPGASSA